MAFIEMTCKCESSFQADLPDNDNLILMWAHAFVRQHADCGFMSSMNTDLPEKMTNYNITYEDTMYKERKKKEIE